MEKNTYFGWMLDNLGYRFENILNLTRIGKDALHNLYMGSPNDLKTLTAGTHGRYRRLQKEDWTLLTYNNTEVMVCTRKFMTDRGVVKLVDRSSEELRAEAKRMYNVLQENGKL